MKKYIGWLSLCAALLGSQTANATVYSEIGDAGHTLATVQSVTAGSTSISGQLGTGDPADVFRFGWGGGVFQAAASTNFDPMLFVFDVAGTLLAFNDDFNDLQSFISVSLGAGEYLLGIDNFPLNIGGNIDGFASSANGVGSYTINVSTTTATNISTSTATATAIPEPVSLALLGVGLIGLVATRRRKQSL